MPLKLRILCILGLLTLTAGSAAQAYEKDTHFGLTYFLARSVGFPREAAYKIALANWSVDLDPNTQPLTLSAEVLERFHAFTLSAQPHTVDDTTPGKMATVNKLLSGGFVKNNFGISWRRSLAMGNPGIALHFFEDIYAHGGYASTTDWLAPGHAFGNAHAVDFLSNNKWTARAMMLATLQKLEEFRSLTRNPCPQDEKRMDYVITNLIAVNPAAALHTPDYSAAATILASVLPSTDDSILRRPGLSDGDDRGAAFRINKDGTLSNRPWETPDKNGKLPNLPKGEGLYAPDMPVTIKPLDYLTGENWKDMAPGKDGKPAIVHLQFGINTSDETKGNANAVDFSGRHDWTFVAFDEKASEWHFRRILSKADLPIAIPASFGSRDPDDWKNAKNAVAGKLQAHLFLHYESCQLEGRFYPGKFTFTKDITTGAVRTEVPAGQAGWGPATKVAYVRDWPDVPIQHGP